MDCLWNVCGLLGMDFSMSLIGFPQPFVCVPTWFVVRMFCSVWQMAHSVGEWPGLEYTANLRCLWSSPQALAGTMTPSDSCQRIWYWRSEPFQPS